MNRYWKSETKSIKSYTTGFHRLRFTFNLILYTFCTGLCSLSQFLGYEVYIKITQFSNGFMPTSFHCLVACSQQTPTSKPISTSFYLCSFRQIRIFHDEKMEKMKKTMGETNTKKKMQRKERKKESVGGQGMIYILNWIYITSSFSPHAPTIYLSYIRSMDSYMGNDCSPLMARQTSFHSYTRAGIEKLKQL